MVIVARNRDGENVKKSSGSAGRGLALPPVDPIPRARKDTHLLLCRFISSSIRQPSRTQDNHQDPVNGTMASKGPATGEDCGIPLTTVSQSMPLSSTACAE